MQGLNHKNVVQFQAICNERSAIMLEYLCFDFSLFGTSLTSLAAGMLNQIWHGAEEIISHHKIIDLGEGVYCVTESGNSVNVVVKGVSVTCRCHQSQSTAGFCRHVLAVAETMGNLEAFLKAFNQ